jgi:hypothetical protein
MGRATERTAKVTTRPRVPIPSGGADDAPRARVAQAAGRLCGECGRGLVEAGKVCGWCGWRAPRATVEG